MARNGKQHHDDRQQSVLADVPPAKDKGAAKEPAPIRFRTGHDVTVTYQALERRVERLKKQAKSLLLEGYPREARSIRADIDAITEYILPVFKPQRELPLKSEEDVERSLMGGLRPVVFKAFDGLDDTKVAERFTPANLQRRREELVNTVIQRVFGFAVELYDSAYNAGYAARKTDAHVLIAEAAKSLSTERVD